MKKTSLFIFLLLSWLSMTAQDQEKKAIVGCIAFYNLENIFDTIDDPLTDDEEFLPTGANQWTSERYRKKLDNMSEVIVQVGGEMVKGGPSIIGLSEVENRGVLEDLIRTTAMKPAGYQIVHADSPDRRGVDVALLYKPSVFTVTSSMSARLYIHDRPDFLTRDQLVVTGNFNGEPLTVIVNHWPSRGNAPEFRMEAARLARYLVDSLLKLDPQSKIIVMGDLNDDPVDPSVFKQLNAIGRQKDVGPSDLFNPMWQMFKDGVGSLAYRDSWNLFDQVIVSHALLGNDRSTYKFYKANVFSKKFLLQKEGQYAGYPFRTFAGGAYAGGYSDHLPVYIFIVKEALKDVQPPKSSDQQR
ncbi:MAG: endonuclease/exonuclease/phosphatase family protein [Bacteroidetes bacterium]|nr:endonuclease/exonuclease/phosphatase family protein [Bacteroidota bacterium]